MNAVTVYYVGGVIHALAFTIYATVSMVYMVQNVDLNALQLILVGTALEASVFIFEIPTGIVADVYSRRLSVIIGQFVIGFGIMFTGFFPLFVTVVLAQIIWGTGYTFTSGAHSAWITDEVGEENVGPIFMRMSQLARIGSLIGIGLSVALASIDIVVPIILGGAMLMGIGVFYWLFMPEENFHPTPRAERETFKTMRQTFWDGLRAIRGHPVLMTFVVVEVIYGISSEGWDRLWTAHLLEQFSLPSLGNLQPIVWFGIISAVGSIASIFTTEIARRRLDTTNQRAVVRLLVTFYALTIGGIIVFALTNSFGMALIAFWVVGVFRATAGPIYEVWINLNIESKVRATVLSMGGQSNAIGQVAGGPAVGFIGTRYSIRTALVASGLLFSPILWLLARTQRHPPVPTVADTAVVA
jgi:DHA3 family tetracycline resistance protein-like MFS transporter